MTSPYYVQYDGYYTMSWHDREENALKRWFENFKVCRYDGFACETEWLVVKEIPSETRRKKRYVCEIGDDGRGTKREVIMDHSAPPAPILTFAAKRRYEPPPPKTQAELRREAEWNRMYMLGYEPVRRPRYRPISPIVNFGEMSIGMMDVEMEYDIEWVRRRPLDPFILPREQPVKPAPVRHRRNV